MNSIAEIEQEIIADFELFEGWEEKYQYIIEIGQKLPPLDDKYKTEDYKIKGCQSSVWLHGEEREGRLFFSADSDSTFVKGEIALLMNVLSGQKAEDILNAPLSFIDAIGLRQHVAVTRANGLAAMIKQMKTYALAVSTVQR
ncbi:MAG: SufE family protein [Bacteroidia bacterium]|jgi:cysteine desulfuration protein SufE|nr:SufE family protein [Bacteroidia bacterium]